MGSRIKSLLGSAFSEPLPVDLVRTTSATFASGSDAALLDSVGKLSVCGGAACPREACVFARIDSAFEPAGADVEETVEHLALT